MNESNYSIRAVERVCDLLDLVQEHAEGMSLAALAVATGLPKSSVFRYLSTLEGRGYVERNEAGDYRVGIALSGERIEGLTRRLTPHLRELWKEFGETINVGILDGSRVAYLSSLESPAAIRNAPRSGEREYIHSTALGKVLAAARPVDHVEAILQQEGMPQRTAKTIVDPAQYLWELQLTRERGYGLDDEENEVGGRCLAVRVPGTSLPVAISLSAPVARLPLEDVAAVARRMTVVLERVAEFTDADFPPARETTAGSGAALVSGDR